MAMPDSTASARRSRQLKSLKRSAGRLWPLSPVRLWRLSIALDRRGRWRIAFVVKQLGTILFHNSLSPQARIGDDVSLGHYSHGVVVNGHVQIGDHVEIWQNVTLTAGRRAGGAAAGSSSSAGRIVIDDYVRIGANAVLIGPRGGRLRIGRGARIGAGAIVTGDVPPGATAVGPPARVLSPDPADGDVASDGADVASAQP